ncbi:hypothetical protein DENSPDRAFT_788082, partial [Dentipellis sp. KUC8613]
MSAFERAKLAAQNPDAAAKFFDVTIKAFLDIIVRYGRQDPGLFGQCEAYFGTVEAQGRGTLHCHMLLWLKGNLNPQALRDEMVRDESFKTGVFDWIESIVKCEFPYMTHVMNHTPERPVVRPQRSSDRDPRLQQGPYIPSLESMSTEEMDRFQIAFRETVTDLAEYCQWHEHHETCWKNLKPGQPRDHAHCRMRMDGTTRDLTSLDDATQSILLRRLHPWLNNFNDVVLFLLKSNMDVKFIGSGEAAKALVFYITDYITKSSLPTHIGLRALTAAIKSNALKFVNSEADRETVSRSLLTKVVNAMMARQELSHPQVMSYLVGGGDHYSSHQFQNLNWGSLDKWVREQMSSSDPSGVQDGPSASESADADAGIDDEAELTVTVSPDGVVGSSLLMDYRYRGCSADFETLSVWEHAALVFRLTKNRENARLGRL